MTELAEHRLITLNEAADILAVSTRTARRYISAGYLDAVRIGPKTVRVDAASVSRLTTAAPIGNKR